MARRKKGAGPPADAKGAAAVMIAPAVREPLEAVQAALTGEELVRATWRLLQAVAPGTFTGTLHRFVGGMGAAFVDSLGRRLEADSIATLHDGHPGYAALKANPGLKVLPTTGNLPPEPALLETEFYRKWMAPLGWRHAVALVFWDAPVIGELDLICSVFRTAAEGDFSPAELAALEALHPQIDQARRRVRSMEAERATRRSLEAQLRRLSVSSVVLDWDLDPVFHNRAARDLCAVWLRGPQAERRKQPASAFRVPPELLEACRQLRGEWEQSLWRDPRDRHQRSRTVQHPTVPGLKATVLLAPPGASMHGSPGFLIELETPLASPAPPEEEQGSALARLTPRERTLVRLVCDGRSNQEIAEELSLSLSTVKGQLHATFRKLGVPNRSRLIVLLR